MRLLCALFGAALSATAAHGQTVPAGEAPPPIEAVHQATQGTAGSSIRIPMTTPVDIEIIDEISSKTAQIDAMFPIRLRKPVVIDGVAVVPAGTMGMGQVIHAQKAGWGGRAGELIITARYLDVGGTHIPLRRFRLGETEVGSERVNEAMVATMAIPLGGFLVNGGEKILLAGTHANAIVAADTELTVTPEPAAVERTTQASEEPK